MKVEMNGTGKPLLVFSKAKKTVLPVPKKEEIKLSPKPKDAYVMTDDELYMGESFLKNKPEVW